MNQKLIMPFVRQMMLCGYKNPQYKAHWGYHHYGVDVSTIQGGAGDDPTVYASGDGEVVAAGRDAKLGYALCVVYRNAVNHKTGQVCDLVGRYMHLRSIAVKAGDVVSMGDPLGVEGKEGTGDYHLHLEFDTDVEYPAYTPQVKGSTFWKKGTDGTVNPSFVLHVGAGQTIVKPTYNPAWLGEEDFVIPARAEEDAGGAAKPEMITVAMQEWEALQGRCEEAEEELARIRELYDGLRDGIEKLIGEYEG